MNIEHSYLCLRYIIDIVWGHTNDNIYSYSFEIMYVIRGRILFYDKRRLVFLIIISMPDWYTIHHLIFILEANKLIFTWFFNFQLMLFSLLSLMIINNTENLRHFDSTWRCVMYCCCSIKHVFISLSYRK